MRYLLLVTSLNLTLLNTTAAHAQPCYPIETAKLLASDGAETDRFGDAVSISGDTAIVGAPRNDDHGTDSGSAYVYEKVNNLWTQVAKLLPSDGAENDKFGLSVSISGETAIVGARYHDDLGIESGSAYVFEKIDSNWRQVAKLLAMDGDAADEFGHSVSISGNTAFVGAVGDRDHGWSSGSVYVFERIDDDWTQVAKLLASDAAKDDKFGYSISLSGDTAVVGAQYDDDRGTDSGSAYVFQKIDDVWVQQDKLLAADGDSRDAFGHSVALQGDNVIVGAYHDEDFGFWSGSAYIFEKNADTWTQKAKLLASDGQGGHHFGCSVSISGETAIVGAIHDDDRGLNSGAAYIFQKITEVWTQAGKIRAIDGAHYDFLGWSVSLSGKSAIVGVHGDDDRAQNAGAAFVYDLNCNNPSCLELTVENLIAGENATFTLSGGTPGAKAVTVYGVRPGQSTFNSRAGYCATLGIKGVSQNRVIVDMNLTFDHIGEIVIKTEIPDHLTGSRLFFQSAEHNTCPDQCISNLIEAVVK